MESLAHLTVNEYRLLLARGGMAAAELLGRLVRLFRRDFQCERVTIFLLDRDGRYVSAIAEGLLDMDIDVKPGEGLVGKAIEQREILVSNRAAYDVRSLCRVRDHYTGFQTHSLLAAPIGGKMGRVIGAVQLINKIGGEFTAADREQMAAVTAELATLGDRIPRPISNLWADWQEIAPPDEGTGAL